MKKEDVLNMYTAEILKVGGDKDKIKLILRIVIENTERELHIKLSGLTYDLASEINRSKAWDSE